MWLFNYSVSQFPILEGGYNHNLLESLRIKCNNIYKSLCYIISNKGSVNVNSYNNNTNNKLESCYCFVDDDKNDFLEDMFPLGIFHEIASYYLF